MSARHSVWHSRSTAWIGDPIWFQLHDHHHRASNPNIVPISIKIIRARRARLAICLLTPAMAALRMDYDKVAVFEGGKVVEFDSPQDRVWTICIWFPFCSFPLNFHWPVPCVLLSPWNQCRNWWRENRSSNHLPKRVGRCEIIWAAAICAAFSDGQCDPYILWSRTFDRLWPSLRKILKLGAKCGIFAERCSALTPSFQKI